MGDEDEDEYDGREWDAVGDVNNENVEPQSGKAPPSHNKQSSW